MEVYIKLREQSGRLLFFISASCCSVGQRCVLLPNISNKGGCCTSFVLSYRLRIYLFPIFVKSTFAVFAVELAAVVVPFESVFPWSVRVFEVSVVLSEVS